MALATLQATLESRGWVGPTRLNAEPDPALLRDRPEFARIVAECERRRELEQNGVRPQLRVAAPGRAPARPPLRLGLHMAGSDADVILRHLRGAVATGTLLAAVQGTVLTGPGA